LSETLLSLTTLTYTVAQGGERFKPNTVLWAFHTIQSSSLVFIKYASNFYTCSIV